MFGMNDIIWAQCFDICCAVCVFSLCVEELVGLLCVVSSFSVALFMWFIECSAPPPHTIG